MYKSDNRVVATLDAGGTNFVFGAMKACEFIIDPISVPAQAHDLDLCLKNMINGFRQVFDKLDEKPSAILAVGGLVTASEDRSDDYPYQRGVLRLRQERISLTATERQVVRIAVMNGGSTIIRPEADGMFLPSGVRVRFEPSQLKPKEQGDLVVEYVPQSETTAAKSFKIFVKGLNVPPRQSAIDVIFGN